MEITLQECRRHYLFIDRNIKLNQGSYRVWIVMSRHTAGDTAPWQQVCSASPGPGHSGGQPGTRGPGGGDIVIVMMGTLGIIPTW